MGERAEGRQEIAGGGAEVGAAGFGNAGGPFDQAGDEGAAFIKVALFTAVG